jgi:hypothetical protein
VIWIVLDYSKKINSISLLIKGAISKEKGEMVKTEDDGIALTGKVNYF